MGAQCQGIPLADRKVVNLEDYRDLRWLVEKSIKAFLKNPTVQARIAMMTNVTTVMRMHRRRRMNFGPYSVTLAKTDGQVYPVIRARRILDACPKCQRDRGLFYIRTQQENLFGPRDLVTYACPDCQEIFAKWEPNGRGDDETAS